MTRRDVQDRYTGSPEGMLSLALIRERMRAVEGEITSLQSERSDLDAAERVLARYGVEAPEIGCRVRAAGET